MPGQDTDQNDTEGTPAENAPAGNPTLTLPPDLIRNSPEYRELQRQVREGAREAGRAKAEAASARSEAEAVRQAAEAQRQAVLAEQMAMILGEDGVDAFNSIADLSAVDPVEAARKFRELVANSAQSAAATSGNTGQAAATGGTQVPEQQQQTPPPPSAGLSGDAPLGQPTTGVDWDAITKDSTDRYAEIVARNQDPVTRARVTDRERGEGFMSWLAASYVKGMKATGRLPRS
jgi:hypothetical protein